MTARSPSAPASAGRDEVGLARRVEAQVTEYRHDDAEGPPFCRVVLPEGRWSSDPTIEAPEGCDDLARGDDPLDDAEVYPDGWFVPRIPHGREEHPLVNRSAEAQELVGDEIARLAEQLRIDGEALTGEYRGCVEDCASDERGRLVVELAAARVPLANVEYVGGRRSAWMEVVRLEQLDSWSPPPGVDD